MSLSQTFYDKSPNLNRDPSVSKFQDARDAYWQAKEEAHARAADPDRSLLAPLVESPAKLIATVAAVLALLEVGTHSQQIGRYLQDHLDNSGPANIHSRQQNFQRFKDNGKMLSPRNTDGNDSGS